MDPDPELERVLRGFEEAAAFAKTYRFEMTDDYLALIARVEAMPENQSGADKSHVWRGLQAYRNSFKNVNMLPPQAVTDPFALLGRALGNRSVRYVLIGVSGINLHDLAAGLFVTADYDLFVPSEPENLVQTWAACEDAHLELWLGDEPLDRPRDRWLADRIIERRALTRATGPDDFKVDLTLVMKGFDFETVWNQRHTFGIEGVEIPTARLLHIVASKQAAGRPKDQLFLATHKDALEQLLKKPDAG